MVQEFKDFLFRGNIVELAVAFVMGLPRSSTRSSRICSCP